MTIATYFPNAFSYADFLTKYGSAEQQQQWATSYGQIVLNPAQTQLLATFKRQMKVLVIAGAWCGDCRQQVPIFEHFAAANSQIVLRYLDRDSVPELAAEWSTCGAVRVPTVIFLSEDDQVCGRYGDRTLSKYRFLAQKAAGLVTLGVNPGQLLSEIVQDWLNEFERMQLMLRTSTRLRQIHGD